MTDKDLIEHLRGPVADAAKRFIDHWFRNEGPKPEICIPASETDSDLVLTKGIKAAAAALEAKEAMIEKREKSITRMRQQIETQSTEITKLSYALDTPPTETKDR